MDYIVDMNTSIMVVPSQKHFAMPAQSPHSKGPEDIISMVDRRHQQGERSATSTDRSECVRPGGKFCD